MNKMSEQLWYTWSTWGFSGGNGFQIRAASPGFLDARGSVSTHTGQLQALMKHLNYTLPQDVVNKNEVIPEKTPVCLAFLHVEQEMVLIHKRYTGLDGARRPGAFFSHLLTKLPEFASLRPEGSVEFSAREAICLWGSPFWKASEHTLVRGDTKLLSVVLDGQYADVTREKTREYEYAHAGPLNAASVTSINPQHLLFVIQAFLSCEKGQRLFIAADPTTVALLIWALTHCLPRTLTRMHDLTFSTYERIDEEKSAAAQRLGDTKSQPTIVGTNWLYEPRDLPDAYYMSNNRYGFALNCYSIDRQTPLSPKNDVTRFAQFAVECFQGQNGHSIAELDDLWQKAERDNITELDEFLALYITYQESLSREEIIELLKGLNRRIGLRQRGERVQVNAETLQRENVLRSIFHWAVLDLSWWQTDCAPELTQLRTFVDNNSATRSRLSQGMGSIFDAVVMALQILTERALRRLLEAIRTKTTGSQANLWSNMAQISLPGHMEVSQWGSLFTSFSVQDLDTPTYKMWWNDDGKKIFNRLRQQMEPRQANVMTTPLTPFAEIVAEKVRFALQESDQNALSFWQEVMSNVAMPKAEPEVWADLFQSLDPYLLQPIYRLWWDSQGRDAIGQLRLFASTQSKDPIAEMLQRFAISVMEKLINALQTNNEASSGFLSDVLVTLAPYANFPRIWYRLFLSLERYVPVYRKWWNPQGKTAADALRHLEDVALQQRQYDPTVEILNLATPALHIAEKLIEMIRDADTPEMTDKQKDAFLFWTRLLATMAPYASYKVNGVPEVWVKLLHDLWPSIYTQPFSVWWQQQGKAATTALNALEDRKSAQALEAFVQQCVLPEFEKYIGSSAIRHTISGPLSREIVPPPLLLDFLVVVVPDTLQKEIWAGARYDLLSRLTQNLTANVYELYPWEVRQTLLRTWASIGALHAHEYIHPWLKIKWSEIRRFNKLPLPPEWHIIARKMLLGRANEISPAELVSLIVTESVQFEEALSQCIAAPDTVEVAINLFALLARNNYPRKVPLLGALLLAGRDQPEYLLQKLLKDALLRSDEAAELLEDYCQEILTTPKLPLVLQRFVIEYLRAFDVERLGRSSTTEFLKLLQKRIRNKKLDPSLLEDFSAYVRGWSSLSQLVAEPSTSRKWLKDAGNNVRAMSNLQPGVRSALSAKLLPLLIEQVTTESDLVRVIDNLGVAFVGEQKDKDALEPGLVLLRTMVTSVSERYKDQLYKPLIPYITLTLNDSRTLSSPKKEEFVDSVLRLLLLHITSDGIAKLDQAATFWPDETTTADWYAYGKRMKTAYEQEVARREYAERLANKPSLQGGGYSASGHVAGSQSQMVVSSPSGANNAPVPQAPSTQLHAIAKVKNRPITQEQVQSLSSLRDEYLAYRIDYLTKNQRDEEAEIVKKWRVSGEQKNLLAALNDLIDDAFISMEIEKDIINEIANYEMFLIGKDIIDDFKQYEMQKNNRTLEGVELTENDLTYVLQVFRRKEIFAPYLVKSKGWENTDLLPLEHLQMWLDRKRKKEKDAIDINYKGLGLSGYKRLILRMW